MARLILHVGPGKCGSSSIQSFFATQPNPCLQRSLYRPLRPRLISQLNREPASEEARMEIRDQLERDLADCEALLLSHEFCFQAPVAVRAICQVAERRSDGITIIGYCRRQSAFLVSAYSQWLFRSPKRIGEVNGVVAGLGLDPLLFTGLERQLIASIADDFRSARQLSGYRMLDWSHAYSTLIRLTREHGAVVRCGTLPSRESDTSLIEDFCAKAGLTLRPGLAEAARLVANRRYDHALVEAINVAASLGLTVMGPHEDNDILDTLTSLLTPTSAVSEFVSELQVYVDAYFWESNQSLCEQHGLEKEYFRPAGQPSKAGILDRIHREAEARTRQPASVTEHHRLLTARMVQLCIRLAKRRPG